MEPVWQALTHTDSQYLRVDSELRMELPLRYQAKTEFWGTVLESEAGPVVELAGLGRVAGSWDYTGAVRPDTRPGTRFRSFR